MNIHNLLGITAAVLAFAGTVPYVHSILKGETKPNRATWFIWDAVSLSLLASYHYSGASTTIWLSAAYTITTTIVFILSFKYGVGGYEWLDIVCLLGAVLGLVFWWSTNNPVTALYMNVFIDALGFLPTIKKAYVQPETENKLSWKISTTSNAFNVAALTTWQFKIALFPVYNFIFNAIVAMCIMGFVPKKNKAKS